MGTREIWTARLGSVFYFIGIAALVSGQSRERVYELDSLVVRPTELFEGIGKGIDPLQLPMSISTIGTDVNRSQDNRTLRGVLENSAGVTTASGNGVHDFFIIRGVDSLQGGLVLVDGVAEPEATRYPMHHIGAVQVSKGPGSFLFGANSLVGTVNLVRKPPRFDRFVDLRLGIGSHESIRLETDMGTYLDSPDAAIRINTLVDSAESHRDTVDSDLVSVNPSLLWHVSPFGTIRVDVDYQSSDVTPDAGIPVIGDMLFSSSRSLTFQESADESEQRLWRIQVRYDHEFSPELQLRNRMYFTRLDWESIGTVYAGFVLFDVGIERDPTTLSRIRPRLDDRQQVFGEEVELSLNFSTYGLAHQVILGAEYTRFTDVFTLELPLATDINTRSRITSPSLLSPLPTNSGDATSDLGSLYAIDHLNWGQAWTFHLGSRVDWLDFEDDSRNTSRSESQYSPFAGVVFKPIGPMAIFANAGFGFAPPSTQVAGPRGRPEESQQFEVGLKLSDEDRRFVAQASLYSLERDHIAIPDSSGLLSENGSQDARGIEVEFEARWTDSFRTRLAYGLLDSELGTFREQSGAGVFDRSGSATPFTPDHTVNVWSELQVASHWSLGVGLRGVSDQFIAPDNQFEIDGYLVTDVAIFYQQPQWDAALHVKNVTDESYQTRGQGSVSVIPEDGISVVGTVTVRL